MTMQTAFANRICMDYNKEKRGENAIPIEQICSTPGLPLWCAKPRIGLLGGTFNPIHNGHMAMARAALEEFALDEVVFIPTGQPPHKNGESIARAEDRIAMIDAAINGQARMRIDRMEIERAGTTYTIDTLRALRARLDAEYYFLVGADTVLQLSSWKDYALVLALCSFIAFPRTGESDCAVEREMVRLTQQFGAHILLSHRQCPQVSSTQIRMRAQRGQPLVGLVPAEVEWYIRHKGVYHAD